MLSRPADQDRRRKPHQIRGAAPPGRELCLSARPAVPLRRSSREPGYSYPLRLVSPPAGPGEPVSQLELSGRHYDTSRRASAGLPNGEIAVDGNEIAFFNTATCELFLPEGVGHYRWKVSGKRLHLDAIGNDPCSVRDPFLKDVIYERTD